MISASTPEEHLDNVKTSITKIRTVWYQSKKNQMCFLCVPPWNIWGHRVDSKDLHTLESKVTAVMDAPRPRDVQELRSFLGTRTLLW